ncbi:ATP-binding protein [Kitasatospora sp. NPDC057198]|uniref:ATP-binding protein n=1 Tax=Kitasatospora sp. NPDC057198 TaxID=3346046 RepID=UPI00362DC8A9
MDPGTGESHWHFQFGPDGTRSVGPGMGCVRDVLAALPGADDSDGDGDGAARRRDDVLLVACELLANACDHTPGATCLDVDLADGHLTVAVTDPVANRPLPGPWRPGQPHGHGLHVVEQISTEWGVSPFPGGKTVWAALPTP